MSDEKRGLAERWDEIATETVARRYREVGVEPGDHLGFMLRMWERYPSLADLQRRGIIRSVEPAE